MAQITVAGQHVERCETCRGCWFDSSELSAAINSTGPEAELSLRGENSQIDIHYPRCRIRRASSSYAYDSGIPVNKCPQCHGVWLQDGQLQRLGKYRLGSPKPDALAESIADYYATEIAWLQFTELVQSRVLSFVVVVAILMCVFIHTGRLEMVLRLLSFLLLPIMCIWFADAMGNLTGISLGLGRPRITEKTPGIAIAISAWILLLTVAVVIVYQMM